MVNPSLTITHADINGGVAVRVMCGRINLAWKNAVTAEPNALNTAVVEAQTQGFENPVMTIPNIKITGAANTLTYAMILTLAKIQYTGSNAPVLTCNFGSSSQLVGSDGATTSIKFVVKSFDFSVDVSDSKNGYMPTANLVIVETA